MRAGCKGSMIWFSIKLPGQMLTRVHRWWMWNCSRSKLG